MMTVPYVWKRWIQVITISSLAPAGIKYVDFAGIGFVSKKRKENVRPVAVSIPTKQYSSLPSHLKSSTRSNRKRRPLKNVGKARETLLRHESIFQNSELFKRTWSMSLAF